MTKNRDTFYLLLAALVVVVVRSATLSGLYYDPDDAYSAYSALALFSPHNWVLLLKGLNPPGIALIYSFAFSCFGRSFISVQIFALLFNLCSVALLYLVAKHVLSSKVRFAYLLPLLYAIFSTAEALQGHSANKEIFLAPFEIGAFLCLGLAAHNKKANLFVLSGFLLGAAFLIKQSAFAFFVAGFVLILGNHILSRDHFVLFLRRSIVYTAAFILPFLLLLFFFSPQGLTEIFVRNKLFLVFRYVDRIAVIRQTYLGWALAQIWRGLTVEIVVFGLLALAGLWYCVAGIKKKERLFIFCWFLVPVFIISRSGFHFRHHFIEVLAPFLTLCLLGVAGSYDLISRYLKRRGQLAILTGVLFTAILFYPCGHILFKLTKENRWANAFFLTERYLKSPQKDRYSAMLLKESNDAGRRFLVGQYLKSRVSPTDRILVWDDIDGGSILLWSGSSPSVSWFSPKAAALPKKLVSPVTLVSSKSSKDAWGEAYRQRQQLFMKRLRDPLPLYIVIAKRYALRPNAPLSPDQQLALEKAAFKEFFDYVDKNYVLETQLYDFQILRRVEHR